VGVCDLAPDLAVGAFDRELVGELDDARVERAGGRDHLERGPGWLGGRIGDPGQREDRAAAGVEHGDSAEQVAERDHRSVLEPGIDRGPHRLARLGLAGGEHAPAPDARLLAGRRGDELAPGLARQALVVGELEPRVAGQCPGWESASGERLRLCARGRADRPDDVRSGVRGHDARHGRALGERGAVCGQDRRPAGRPSEA
jgi:hypothetical protein